jgi:hypothetical protein
MTVRLYVNNNDGELRCAAHGGNYLRVKVNAHPNARSHHTPLGTWTLVDASFARMWEATQQEYGGIPLPLQCEKCQQAPDLTEPRKDDQ